MQAETNTMRRKSTQFRLVRWERAAGMLTFKHNVTNVRIVSRSVSLIVHKELMKAMTLFTEMSSFRNVDFRHNYSVIFRLSQ